MRLEKPSAPVNAYPVASPEGRNAPTDVFRPLGFYHANNSTIEFQDQVNLIEVIVESDVIYLRDNVHYLIAGEEVPEAIDLMSESKGINRLSTGTYLLVVGQSVTIAGEAFINHRILWQSMAPISKMRVYNVN